MNIRTDEVTTRPPRLLVYYVWSGALNPTHSLTHSLTPTLPTFQRSLAPLLDEDKLTKLGTSNDKRTVYML